MNIRNYGVVSMPYIGLPPFLQKPEETEKPEETVSMPYIGLPPFLHEKKEYRTFHEHLCQCPISGFPHFYPPHPETKEVYVYCVNALYRASPISTNKDNARKKIIIKSVNALYRASPISTLSLQKPFKINGFRGRFQGVIVRKF